MKNLLSTLIAASAMLSATAALQAQSTIGYTTGEMGRSTVCRSGSGTMQGLAIKLSHDKLQPLAGKTISNIKVAFGSRNTTGKVATLFITDDLDAEVDLRSQQVSIASANKWQVNELEQPYTITGEEQELYIGYYAEIPTTYNLLQCDFTNELRGCSYAITNGHWTDLYGTGYGSANIYAGLSETVDFTDAMLAEVDLSSNFYIAEQSYQEHTHLFNFGTKPITKVQLTLLKDGETSTSVIDGLNIPQYGTYDLALPELTAAETGSALISASIQVMDADELDTTDNEFQSSAFFYPANIERSIFVEEFTGQGCRNCPAGKTTLNAAVEQSGLPCVEIMHHSGYSADSFTTDADAECTWFYGSNSTYAPAAMFNRLTNPAVSSVPVQNVGLDLCLSSLEYASKQQPYVSMALTSAFNAETRMVDVSLDLLDHNTLPGQTVLNVYLIQDSIIAYQEGASAEYRHDGVLRKVLTGSAWGLILPDSFVPGATQHYTVSYELPDAIYSDYYSGSNPQYLIPTDPEHMRIVAYVANYDSRDYNNNVVHNCIEVPLVNGSYTQRGMTTGLEAIESDAQPARAGIFDLNGRQYEADAQLPAGLYIVNGKKMLICE